MQKRSAAVIIKENKILLMHRIRDDWEYFTFPGGSVEVNETPEQTVVRELEEEFTIKVSLDKLLFEIENSYKGKTVQEYFFLAKDFTSTPVLGGEEKDRMNEKNQYAPVWVNLSDLPNTPLLPTKAKEFIIKLYC